MWRMKVQREGGDHFFVDFGQQTAAGGQFWSSRGDFKFDVLIVDIYFQFHSEMSKPQYNCIYCGQFMTTREANRIHIQQECLERPDAALPCACLFCGLRFPSKASLRVHLSRWCKEKWFSHFFFMFSTDEIYDTVLILCCCSTSVFRGDIKLCHWVSKGQCFSK